MKQTVKSAIDEAKWLVKDVLLGHELPARYNKAAKAPIDERKVLFIEGKLETVPDSFSVMMSYWEKHPDFDVTFIGLGQQVRGYATYRLRCLKLMDELATAHYVFLEDASDVVSCVDLRSETKVAQLWHACGAFKKWGMSVADLKFGNTAKNIMRHPFYKNLSLVTVSSPEVEWAYREAMMLEDEPQVVKPLGVSRTDVFFDEGFARASNDWVHARFPGIGARKVLLYLPTFRGSTRTATGPDELDLHAMKRELGDTWALVIKHHPFVKSLPEIPQDCSDFAFMACPDDPSDSLMVAADAMITDYSSVVFEYSLLERPMAFFAYDLDDYNDWRGFYYDFEEMTPGPVVKTTAEVIAFAKSAAGQGEAQSEVRAFRQKFMSACDGHATRRICDYLQQL